jgi:hypothetical protein
MSSNTGHIPAAEALRLEYSANEKSYTTGDLALVGLGRREGDVRWRLVMHNQMSVPAAVVSKCLVVIDQGAAGGLLCIDPASCPPRRRGRRERKTACSLVRTLERILLVS